MEDTESRRFTLGSNASPVAVMGSEYYETFSLGRDWMQNHSQELLKRAAQMNAF